MWTFSLSWTKTSLGIHFVHKKKIKMDVFLAFQTKSRQQNSKLNPLKQLWHLSQISRRNKNIHSFFHYDNLFKENISIRLKVACVNNIWNTCFLFAKWSALHNQVCERMFTPSYINCFMAQEKSFPHCNVQWTERMESVWISCFFW